MAIIVSGTPGTGKTTIAKKLAKQKGYLYFDVLDYIKKEKLYDYYDRSRKSYVVDEKILARKLETIIKKNEKIVVDSHMSHYINPKYVELCIITKCDLKVLEKRLKKRKYTKKKIRENLDSEIFDICYQEALAKKHKIKIINTTKRATSARLLLK